MEAGSERQAQEGYCDVGTETPAATCCSQEPAHTLDVQLSLWDHCWDRERGSCRSAMGLQTRGLQWDVSVPLPAAVSQEFCAIGAENHCKGR